MDVRHEGFIAAVGTFDGVHRGHASVARQLVALGRARGLRTMVITFGRHPLSIVAPGKCPGQLISATRREKLLLELGIDEVVTLDFDPVTAAMTAEEFISMIRSRLNVKMLAMGFNNRIGSDRKTGADLAPATAGVEIAVLGELSERRGVCSSAIREALAAGKVEEASELLGRPFEIEGKVVGGKHLGSKIGFPTANLVPGNPDQIVPPDGVYAVDTILPDGSEHRAMVNIGHRPTVDNPGSPRTIEAHIIGYEGDLYGTTITLRFLRRLRDEQRFDSLEALVAQLERDRREALNLPRPANSCCP